MTAISPPHDVNGEDAALMAREKVIGKVADDGIGFVPGLGHDPADQDAGAAVPFEVDHAVGFTRAVDFRPAMRTAGTLMLGWDKLEFFLELRIAHDLVAQRTAPCRDDVDYRLHSLGEVLRRQCQFISSV